jgi:hypothetical protein
MRDVRAGAPLLERGFGVGGDDVVQCTMVFESLS